MITVLEAIELSTEYLKKKSIESPRINAELLLASILHCKRLDLYLQFDRPVTDSELEEYRDFIKRRAQFEPLQYITGSVEFYGLIFKVNPSVLIPRPETELLVETIINIYKSGESIKILDIGCGSGNIAIILASHLQDSEIIATDFSEEAIEVAKKNAELNSVESRIKFLLHNILKDSIDGMGKFDLIVSNPPYVSETEYEQLQKEIKNYEPKIAVSDFNDGYNFYRSIISSSNNMLKAGGKLFFELSDGQKKLVEELMKSNHYSNIRVVKDYLGIERIIYGDKV